MKELRLLLDTTKIIIGLYELEPCELTPEELGKEMRRCKDVLRHIETLIKVSEQNANPNP